MKYYIYISSSKINMLLPQIRSAIKKIPVTEVTFNVGFAGGTFRNEGNNIYTLVDNLREVNSYIRKNDSVKNLGENAAEGDWISGECGCYTITLENNLDVALFIGEYNGTEFALGGSSKHIIGSQESSSINIGWSFLPSLLRALNSFNSVESRRPLDFYPSWPDAPEQWHNVVSLALANCKKSRFPFSKMEFLARILLSHEEMEKQFYLATPLYISLYSNMKS